jgi:hypothetical protein
MAPGSPVLQLARSPVADLEGAQHADVQVAAAHHGEAVGVVEKLPPGSRVTGCLPALIRS